MPHEQPLGLYCSCPPGRRPFQGGEGKLTNRKTISIAISKPGQNSERHADYTTPAATYGTLVMQSALKLCCISPEAVLHRPGCWLCAYQVTGELRG